MRSWEEATSVLQASDDLKTSVLVGQIRSASLDLLQAAGMDPVEALEALREASRRASEEGPTPVPHKAEG